MAMETVRMPTVQRMREILVRINGAVMGDGVGKAESRPGLEKGWKIP
jgi:hypothetical protein